MLRDRRSILSIKVGIDLVEKMEGCRVASLDRKNERQCAKTYLSVSTVNSIASALKEARGNVLEARMRIVSQAK